MEVKTVSHAEIDALMASQTERERMYDRAERRAEPHFADEADIELLASEILPRWFNRAVRAGDTVTFLYRLHSLPDTRRGRLSDVEGQEGL